MSHRTPHPMLSLGSRLGSHLPRHVHVTCKEPSGFRWLKANLRDTAEVAPDGRFIVHDEARWAELLRAAEGSES